MSARERIPDNIRAQIADACRQPDASCRAIAREYDVSPGTVRNIAKQAGIRDPFTRAQTKNATRARAVDMAGRRAALAESALDLAEHMLTRARAPYVYYVATKDSVERVELDEPPLDQVRQAATAYGIFIDKHLALIKHDTVAGDNPAAASLVDRIAQQLGLAAASATGYDDDGYPADPPAGDGADQAGPVPPPAPAGVDLRTASGFIGTAMSPPDDPGGPGREL